MNNLLPSQSVNDLRFVYSSTHSPTPFVPMTWFISPGDAVSSLANSVSAVVWD